MRIRSTCSRRSDHDSVLSSLSRMSTVARIQVRSSCSRTLDHDSATRGLEPLTMVLRVRSTPGLALDLDVGVPCVAGVVVGASRVRSPRSPASDHARFVLCGVPVREPRSAGSACFPDHCSTVNCTPSPGPTRAEWRHAAPGVNGKSGQFRVRRDTGTERFLVPVNHLVRAARTLVQEKPRTRINTAFQCVRAATYNRLRSGRMYMENARRSTRSNA